MANNSERLDFFTSPDELQRILWGEISGMALTRWSPSSVLFCSALRPLNELAWPYTSEIFHYCRTQMAIS